jgi:hypothetical protein
MAPLTPTVRDADRPAALQPTARPGVKREPMGPAGAEELPKNWELVHWLDVEGTGEVDRVALVRHRRRGKERILKLYRPGITLAAGVHDAWRGLGQKAPNVAQLHESGEVAGRTYEVMADAGARLGGDDAPPTARRTTLRDVLAAGPGGLADDVVVDVVRQLGLALRALNRAALAHLDLRPDNILVTKRENGDGWLVTVVDFGLAHPLVAYGPTWHVSRSFSTYSAPELVLARSISTATDWWALGMVAAELATGAHPLAGLDEANIHLQLTNKNIPEPAGLPDRVRPLFNGLTTAQEDRWGADQVANWVENVPVPPPPPPQPSSVRPFVFDSEAFQHIPPLMEKFQEKWSDAVAALFGPGAGSWSELAGWLRQFDDHPRFSADQVIEHVERLGAGPAPWPPDALLLALLRHADPGLPPAYIGLPADPVRMAQVSVWDDLRFPQMVDDFWQWRLLAELDGATGARGLAAVDGLWQRMDARCRVVTTVLRNIDNPYHAGLAGRAPEDWRRLLLRVAMDKEFQIQLRTDLTRVRARMTAELGGLSPRFEELAATVLPPRRQRGRRSTEADPDELVGLLMLHLAGQAVADDIDDVLYHRRRLAADAAVRSLSRRRRERWREIERPVAMGWAAAAMGIVFVFAATLLVVADSLPRSFTLASDSAVGVAWGYVAVGLAAQTACEVWLAALIGGPYHDEHSLTAIFLRRAGSVGKRWGNSYLGAAVVLVAVLAVAALALLILLTAPYVLTFALLAFHIRSARRRYRQWRQAREEEEDLDDAPHTSPERQFS